MLDPPVPMSSDLDGAGAIIIAAAKSIAPDVMCNCVRKIVPRKNPSPY
jgi:hypothetical protein